MMITTKNLRAGWRAAALVSALALGGCGGTELNGKIFDLMGISESAQAAAKAEPKMANRSGLVLPPDGTRLPEPGSGEADVATTSIAAVVDPDVKRAADAKERARLHKAYCSGEMNWKERVADKNAVPTSPYGHCGSVGTLLKQ